MTGPQLKTIINGTGLSNISEKSAEFGNPDTNNKENDYKNKRKSFFG